MLLAIDLYCGLFGWGEAFAQEGYTVIGFDIEDMCAKFGLERPASCLLVLQDVTTLRGSQLKDAACIVASPPCQAYSYRAMPWKKAKALPPPDNTLFDACFRIQREACEAVGRHIPMVVENVRGAQKWVGRAKWNFGSYYLWGDVPALMPFPRKASKLPKGNASGAALWKNRPISGYSHQEQHLDLIRQFVDERDDEHKFNPDGTNHPPGSWFAIADSKERGAKTGGRCLSKDAEHKWGTHNMGPGNRQAASAMIARIPFPLAQHIARVFKQSAIAESASTQ